MEMAVRDAVAKLENEAIRHKKKKTTIKRNAKDGVRQVEVATAEDGSVAVVTRQATKKGISKNGSGRTAVPMLVHSFPSHSPLAEPLLLRMIDGVAVRPMTLEEAVKEAA